MLDGRRWCDLDRDMCLVAYGLAMRTALLIVDTRPSFCSDKCAGLCPRVRAGFQELRHGADRAIVCDKETVRVERVQPMRRILQQDRGLGRPRNVLEPVARACTAMRLSGYRPGRPPAATACGGLRRLWRSCSWAQRLNKRIVRAC